MGNSQKPSKLFSLGNQKQLGICGYSETKGKDKIYSEFCLFECGSDTAIEEWGALHECKVSKNGDTIIITELRAMLVGKNFSFITCPFYINKFFYRNDVLTQQYFYNNTLPKYKKSQIKEVIAKCKRLPRENSEKVIEGAYLLLWAIFSGSKEAEIQLRDFQTVHGPYDGHFSGHIAEEWENTWNIYSDYKDPQKPDKFR